MRWWWKCDRPLFPVHHNCVYNQHGASNRGAIMKTALITDVDNTLFDWVDIWYKSFTAMMGKVVDISGISANQLYPSISKVHQRYGTLRTGLQRRLSVKSVL
jgi:hypothetical protein